MAGTEGMKDGSQPERDRLLISQSGALTLMCLSFSECRVKKKKTKNTMTLICCSYFNHKAADYTSLQAVIMWAPPEKIFITKGSVQVALTLTSCQLHKSPGVLCSQHWHCSCLHIPHGGPLSSQHPAPGLHNATYVHVGSMCEKEREVGGGGKGRE